MFPTTLAHLCIYTFLMNIFIIIIGNEPVDKWYEEISVHDFNNEPTDLRSGHFTQVIWKGSRELGVGVAKSRNGQIFVVAWYTPPGNYIGSFKDNVLPMGDKTAMKDAATKTSSKNKASVVTPPDFPREALRVHNEYRNKHGVPDLTLNSEVSILDLV